MKREQRPNTGIPYRVFKWLTVTFAVMAIVCIAAGYFVKEHFYQEWVSISAATDVETRSASYLRALNLCPEKTDAYLLLLKTYNEDGEFTKEESEEFLGLYNSNHNKLKTYDPNYAELHYRIGFLYANGYDETPTSRLRMAMPFFETASSCIDEEDPNRLAVISYNMIGNYYQNYIWDVSSVREITSEEMTSLVEEINTTILAYQLDMSPDTLFNRLGFYEAVCNLFYSQRDVLATTVPYESVQAILDEIYRELPSEGEVQKEQIKQLLDSLNTNREMYLDMIHRAYERKDGVDNAS